MKPEILTYAEVIELQKNHPELVIDDQINLAFEELFDIEEPASKDTKTKEMVDEFEKTLAPNDSREWGEWVYYQWLNRVVHFPPKDKLRALRTSRNRNLITSD